MEIRFPVHFILEIINPLQNKYVTITMLIKKIVFSSSYITECYFQTKHGNAHTDASLLNLDRIQIKVTSNSVFAAPFSTGNTHLYSISFL